MLTYLLIAFVLLLAVAPLLHFRPSKRQRALARMREYAVLHGLQVEYRKLPTEQRGRRPVTGDVIYYGLRLTPDDRRATLKACWIHEGGQWRSSGARVIPPQILNELPESVLVASVDEGGCGVYWTEAGGEAEIEIIREVLTRWAHTL
ncbi:MAG: hypothetical protein R3E54_03155 [Halioglobus sp.]